VFLLVDFADETSRANPAQERITKRVAHRAGISCVRRATLASTPILVW
jgi:hypothetical protein